MALNEKEKTTIKDLQTQEQTCIKKYKKYGQDAKDPVLKELFSTLEKNEQKHYDTLGQILEGKVPECDCNDCEGKEYEPEATYDVMSKSDDKESDAF
jgi:rubrerythrin